jgi:hypothetical protein
LENWYELNITDGFIRGAEMKLLEWFDLPFPTHLPKNGSKGSKFLGSDIL